MASNTTFQKRQKERARLDKQLGKAEKRRQRRVDRPDRTATGGGDPDIAGIVPGPQPVAEEK